MASSLGKMRAKQNPFPVEAGFVFIRILQPAHGYDAITNPYGITNC